MFDLKVLNSVLEELESERGIPASKMESAIEFALAAAYKKEYGKRGQIIRANFDRNTGEINFSQIKIVVDNSLVRQEEEDARDENDKRTKFNPEHHIMLEDAKKMKKDVQLDDEIEFPLETKDDFGRIAAQTAKQVIMQRLREAEKQSVLEDFGEKEGEVVSGTVQRFERGNLYIDLGRTVGIMPYEEQIPGERYRQGERIRALLYQVDESPRGSFIKLSRTRPEFLTKLFESESPELASGIVKVKAVAREPGSRSKIAVYAEDDHIDPIGALVGGRGVRVSTVTSELGGEKLDIIEWSEYPEEFIESALSPAEVMSVELNEKEKSARVEVAEDQQSLAIGRGGQNVRLAAKLTDWKIDIYTIGGSKAISSDDTAEESDSYDRKENPQDEIVVKEEEVNNTDESESESEVEQKNQEAEETTENMGKEEVKKEESA